MFVTNGSVCLVLCVTTRCIKNCVRALIYLMVIALSLPSSLFISLSLSLLLTMIRNLIHLHENLVTTTTPLFDAVLKRVVFKERERESNRELMWKWRTNQSVYFEMCVWEERSRFFLWSSLSLSLPLSFSLSLSLSLTMIKDWVFEITRWHLHHSKWKKGRGTRHLLLFMSCFVMWNQGRVWVKGGWNERQDSEEERESKSMRKKNL